MEFHEIANIFPMMTGDEYRQLVASIDKNGLRDPVELYDGKILDGRNRYTACLELGIEPEYKQWGGDDPWEYVWDKNAERRHLDAIQKVMILQIKLSGQKEWQAERNRKREEANRARSEAQKGIPKAEKERVVSLDTTRSRDDLAKIANVSPATAARAQALFNARPDLAEEVASGNMKFSEATRQRKKDEYKDRVAEMPSGKYRVIYADPPWSYGNTQPDYHVTDPRDHYPTMSLKDICEMPVIDIAEDDAVLFLWVTSPILEEAFSVVKAWGFKYKSSFIWDKVKHNMGHYNSVRHEILLVCVRGSCQPDVRKLFDSVYSEERTEHSRKPEHFRTIIDTIYPYGKRIELFSRSINDGWERYSNE